MGEQLEFDEQVAAEELRELDEQGAYSFAVVQFSFTATRS